MIFIFILILCAACTLVVLLGSSKPIAPALLFMHSTIRETYGYNEPDADSPDAAKKRNIRNIICAAVAAVIYIALAVIASPKTFMGGFAGSMVMCTALSLYIVLGLQCGLIAHIPAFRIRGSENFEAQYMDYDDYAGNLVKMLIAGAVLSVITGLLCFAIGK